MNKLMKTNRLMIVLAMIFGLSLTIPAQQKKTFGKLSIKTDYGYLFINNSSEKSFTLEIRGKDIEMLREGSNTAFIVDDKLLQILQADFKSFISNTEKLTEEEILEKHKIWESEYLGGQFGKKLEIKSENLFVKSFKTMFWGYQRPTSNQEYDRDYVLTKVLGQNVLALRSSLYVGDKLSDYQKFLVETMETLKVSEEPFDIQKLSDEIKKTAPEKSN